MFPDTQPSACSSDLKASPWDTLIPMSVGAASRVSPPGVDFGREPVMHQLSSTEQAR